MAELTSIAKVKRRLKGDNISIDTILTDAAIQEYIDDVSGEILFELNVTSIDAGTPYYQLASKCATDYAAMYCVVRPSGGVTEGLDYTVDRVRVSKSTQLQARMSIVQKYKRLADEALAKLKRPPSDLPFANTQESVIDADILEG